jgi:RNA polymerase sigma-70 factor (ECF subfamily)
MRLLSTLVHLGLGARRWAIVTKEETPSAWLVSSGWYPMVPVAPGMGPVVETQRTPEDSSRVALRPKVGLSDPLEPATVLQVDDRTLVDAVIAGDREAYRELVERESTTVFRCCYRVLGHVEDAEDVAQESFVIAYRSLASWRGDGSVRSWLARIATRQALRAAARRTSPRSLDRDDRDGGLIGRIELADTPDPSARLTAADTAAQVREAVTNLPEPYRETIALRYFAELSIDEIAQTLDRPVGTVKVHVHRGLERLRTALSEESVA